MLGMDQSGSFPSGNSRVLHVMPHVNDEIETYRRQTRYGSGDIATSVTTTLHIVLYTDRSAQRTASDYRFQETGPWTSSVSAFHRESSVGMLFTNQLPPT